MPQCFPTDRALLWERRGTISRKELFGKVGTLSAQLPDCRYAINLCGGRGAFLIGLMAALQRGQVTLLPPSRASGVVREFKRNYPASHILIDGNASDLEGPVTTIDTDALSPSADPAPFKPHPDQIAVVAFTSGSTGETSAHEKSWASVEAGAHLAAERFGLGPETGIIATVPPQHMYGLETSIFYPLIADCSVHAGRPIFPAEIRDAIAEVETAKRLLITTPIHLRSIVKTRLDWPKLDAVISATAPLGVELARQAEERLAAPVHEIYGCTEAGSIANRRTVASDIWTLYSGVTFSATDTDGRPVVHGGHVVQPTPLSDILDRLDPTRFRLLGRSADQVSIAGKRASLGDLNARLNAINGVEDGAFIVRGSDRDGEVQRLGCLFVSASLDEQALIAALGQLIDPAFLPRPIRRVDRLPRNALGKLPRLQLLALLDPAESARQRAGGASISAA
ncbi:MAG: AMP-binding protein [Geminicoccaceae bacterium]